MREDRKGNLGKPRGKRCLGAARDIGLAVWCVAGAIPVLARTGLTKWPQLPFTGSAKGRLAAAEGKAGGLLCQGFGAMPALSPSFALPEDTASLL